MFGDDKKIKVKIKGENFSFIVQNEITDEQGLELEIHLDAIKFTTLNVQETKELYKMLKFAFKQMKEEKWTN